MKCKVSSVDCGVQSVECKVCAAKLRSAKCNV